MVVMAEVKTTGWCYRTLSALERSVLRGPWQDGRPWHVCHCLRDWRWQRRRRYQEMRVWLCCVRNELPLVLKIESADVINWKMTVHWTGNEGTEVII